MAYTKQRSFFIKIKKNYKRPTITKLLFEREDIIVSRQGVARVLKVRERRHNSLAAGRCPRFEDIQRNRYIQLIGAAE